MNLDVALTCFMISHVCIICVIFIFIFVSLRVTLFFYICVTSLKVGGEGLLSLFSHLIDQLVFRLSEHVESCHRAGSETELIHI